MRRTHSLFLSAAVILSSAYPGFAQDSAAQLDHVQPYFEKSTAVALQVDLTKLDLPAAIDWFGQQAGNVPPDNLNLAKGFGGSLVASLRQAGVTHVYGSMSLVDISKGAAVFYLPCRDTKAVKSLTEATVSQFPMLAKFQAHEADGVVILADAQTWSRIESKPNAANTNLLKTLQSGQSGTLQLAASLPENLRQEIAQSWPTTAPENVPAKFSPQALMNDFQSLHVTANLSSQPSFVAYLDTKDAAGAERGQAVLNQFLAAMPTLKMNIELQGKTLKVSLSDQQLSQAMKTRAVASSAVSQNNMKQILLAMHMYSEHYNTLPPRETRTKDGKPLLSWRVHILPYLEQNELYNQFHLNEPWDSTHNAALISKMPAIYAVDVQDSKSGKTQYLLPMLAGGAWFGDGAPVKFEQITDGTSNTIAVVQAPKESAVTWTQPNELDLSVEKLAEKFFGGSDSTNIALFDGSVRKLAKSIDPQSLEAAITSKGQDKVEFP